MGADGLAAESRLGAAIYGGMANGEFPTPEETGGGPSMKNVANTNVVRHAGRALCLWEAGSPAEVTPALETVGLCDFGGAFSILLPNTSSQVEITFQPGTESARAPTYRVR